MKTLALIKKFKHIFGTNYAQDANCVGAWRLNEGTGDTVEDLSASGQDGIFGAGADAPDWESGSPPPGGYVENYLNYDVAKSQNIAIADSGPLDCVIATPMSMGCWCKFTTVNTIAYMCGCFPNNYGWSLNAYYDDPYAYFSQGGTNYWKQANLFSTGSWYHFYATKAADNTKKLYLDGVELVGASGGGVATNIVISSFYIGSWGSSSSYGMSGKLSELALFNRVLDASEINAIMDEGIIGGDPPFTDIKRGFVSGFHCFVSNFIRAKVGGYAPAKLPDGTLF